MADIDRLPPTAYCAEALHRLDEAGLITRMQGDTARTVRARLTEAGKTAVLSERYRSPNGGVEQPRQALRFIAEFAGERAELVPGMQGIAEVARRGLAGGS